jgi:RNA polymerase sigma-70 factor (ECF subfamily)
VIERSLARPSAFAAIFDRHFNAVHGYLTKRVGANKADDLTASTFAVAFEQRHRFRSEATTARPWLFGIATNLVRVEWRSERRTLELLATLHASSLPVYADESYDGPPVGEILAELDHDQLNVLLLHAWEQLSYEETAAVLEIPVGTVRSRLARARVHLRSILDRQDDLASEPREMTG